MTLFAIAAGVTLGLIVMAYGLPWWLAMALTALTAWVIWEGDR